MKKLVLFLLLIPSIAFSAGTVNQDLLIFNPTGKYRLTITWEADSGDGSVPETAFDSDITERLSNSRIKNNTCNQFATLCL